MLVELGLVEQRYQAVLEVLNDGASVTDVARRRGVARQTVHEWLRRYARDGLGGLADRTSRPLSCPHQMDPVVEARVVEMRRVQGANALQEPARSSAVALVICRTSSPNPCSPPERGSSCGRRNGRRLQGTGRRDRGDGEIAARRVGCRGTGR